MTTTLVGTPDPDDVPVGAVSYSGTAAANWVRTGIRPSTATATPLGPLPGHAPRTVAVIRHLRDMRGADLIGQAIADMHGSTPAVALAVDDLERAHTHLLEALGVLR